MTQEIRDIINKKLSECKTRIIDNKTNECFNGNCMVFGGFLQALETLNHIDEKEKLDCMLELCETYKYVEEEQ